MTRFKTRLIGAAVVALSLAVTTTAANAYVACNRFGECWRVHQPRYAYPPRLGVRFYGDDWRVPGAGYYWRRDRDDRGYWWHNRWRRF